MIRISEYSKRGKKGLEVDINVRLADGTWFRERRKAPVEGRANAKRWAEERVAHLIRHGTTEEVVKPEVSTLATFVPRFMDEYANANREKPSSIESKESIFRVHLVPAFGDLPLDQITTAKVQELKAELAKKQAKLQSDGPKPKGRRPEQRSAKTINNVLTVLSTTLRVAVEWGVLEAMPCKVKLLKAPPRELEFYDFSDWERLVAAAEKLDPRIHLTVLLGGEAGLRVGEMVALERADIDFKRGVVKVRRQERRGEVTVPKGGRGREVPLTQRLLKALKDNQHLRCPRMLWRDDKKNENKVERPLLVKWMSRAQRLAGLTDNGGLHILRHTFCSHLAMRGASVMAIKELAGHRDMRTTMRYMHLAPNAKVTAIQLLDGVTTGDILETGLKEALTT